MLDTEGKVDSLVGLELVDGCIIWGLPMATVGGRGKGLGRV